MQYLSEVERGRKEPSSEVLAAVTGALRLTLVDLTRLGAAAAESGRPHERAAEPSGGPSSRPSGPVALAA